MPDPFQIPMDELTASPCSESTFCLSANATDTGVGNIYKVFLRITKQAAHPTDLQKLSSLGLVLAAQGIR